MILWFSEFKETDFNQVGGKGYNLSKMLSHGLNVPNGFVVSAKAYDEFITTNGLDSEIKKILKGNLPTIEKSGQI